MRGIRRREMNRRRLDEWEQEKGDEQEETG